MTWQLFGRSDELARLRGGAGRSRSRPDAWSAAGRASAPPTLVARALGDRAHRSYVAAPLTDADHRALLAERLDLDPGRTGRRCSTSSPPARGDARPDRARAGRRSSTCSPPARDCPRCSRRSGRASAGGALPLHLVLVGNDPAALGALSAEGGPLADVVTLDLELGALPFREVTGPLRAWPARDRIVAWIAAVDAGGHTVPLGRVSAR